MINTSAITEILLGSGERNGRRTKVSFVRTMVQALELLQLAKCISQTFNSGEIKPTALAVIELCLPEGIR